MLLRDKEETEQAFKSYVARVEQTKREELKVVEDLRAEIAHLKELRQQESQKIQNQM